MVLAPGLGSTSTCWPSFTVSPSAMTRTRASIAPPGLNGTTMRMGLVGQPPPAPPGCAQPPDERKGAANAAVTTLRLPIAFRDISLFSPCARREITCCEERLGLYSGTRPIHSVWTEHARLRDKMTDRS